MPSPQNRSATKQQGERTASIQMYRKKNRGKKARRKGLTDWTSWKKVAQGDCQGSPEGIGAKMREEVKRLTSQK